MNPYRWPWYCDEDGTPVWVICRALFFELLGQGLDRAARACFRTRTRILEEYE